MSHCKSYKGRDTLSKCWLTVNAASEKDMDPLGFITPKEKNAKAVVRGQKKKKKGGSSLETQITNKWLFENTLICMKM